MKEFRLPDLGEGLEEAEIVSWHVGPGDHVVIDQPLVSVETEKAVVEIPSPWSGRIRAIHGQPGDIVATGAVLVEFEESAAADSGTVVGRVPAAEPRPAEAAPAAGGVRAAPAVRALARRLGVDLRAIAGSGPDGAVLQADVEAAAAPAAPAGQAGEPLRGVRRAMARNMERAHTAVVPATVTDEADIGDWPAATDITMRLVRAIAAACRAEPSLNAWYLGTDKGRIVHDHVDLGIAMDTPDGLFVPVLRDIGKRTAEDLRDGLEAMKRDVGARSVPLAELRGQTITLSNFGMFGGRHASLVVLPPQVAIVGAGRVHDAVVPRAGKAAIRRTLPLSLTFDHRGVMGGEASRFLAALIADLELAD